MVDELGRGGMGVVYKARDILNDRVVALKVLNVGITPSERATVRFKRESELIGRLSHPGIVRLFESGAHCGHPFYSMEFVDGASLATMTREGPLSVRDAAQILEKMARAISYAHEHQVVHRDLKPSNVLVDSRGEPRVTDFGIARELGSSSDLTLSRQILGTPSYMAPEQLRGGKGLGDTRADIYALGAVLYHLLTARPPFHAEGFQEILTQVAEDDPVPVRRLNASVPRPLEVICLKCLEKDPARRYATCGLLAEDLERFLNGRRILARPVGPVRRFARRCRRRPVLTTLATLLILAVGSGIGGVLWFYHRAEAARIETERGNARLRAMVSHGRLEHAENNVDQRQPTAALTEWARVLREDPLNAIAPARLVNHLSWNNFALPVSAPFPTSSSFNSALLSPDCDRVAVASYDGFAQVFDLARGGAVTPQLRHDKSVLSVAFSPNGNWVASASTDRTARVWDARTGGPIAPPLTHPGTVQHLAFSPDGTCLAVTGDYQGEQRGAWIHLWDLPSGRLRCSPLTNSWFFHSVEFSPDGNRLLAASTDRRAHLWSAESGLNAGFLRHDGAVLRATFSPDGRRIATASIDRTARLWDAQTLQPVVAPLLHQDSLALVEFSRSSKLLLTASNDGQVKVFDAATGEPRFLSVGTEGPLRAASFDPAETRMITAGEDGTARVWNLTTGTPWCAPLLHDKPVRLAEFSPDGTRIVTVAVDGRVRIWDGAPGALAPRRLAHDERLLAARFTRPEEVLTVTDGGRLTRWRWALNARLSARGATGPGTVTEAIFGPNPERILLTGPNLVELWDVGRTNARLASLRTFVGEASPAFSPDGRWVAVGEPDRHVRILDASSGQGRPVRFPISPRNELAWMELSSDARFLFTGELRGAGRVWDPASDRTILEIPCHVFPRSVRFSPDNTRLAASVPERLVRIYDLASGRPTGSDMVHGESVRRIEFAHSGRTLATVASDSTLRVWDANSGKAVSAAMRHPGPLQHVEFSPDDQSILTLAADKVLHVWNGSAGQPRFNPLRARERVVFARFLPDGGHWVSATENGRAIVRDTATGQPISETMVHGAAIHSADLSGDGRALVLVGSDNSVSVWELLVPPSPAPAWLADLAEAVAGQRLDENDVTHPIDPSAAFALRTALGQTPGEDFYSRWARWFCGARDGQEHHPSFRESP